MVPLVATCDMICEIISSQFNIWHISSILNQSVMQSKILSVVAVLPLATRPYTDIAVHVVVSYHQHIGRNLAMFGWSKSTR